MAVRSAKISLLCWNTVLESVGQRFLFNRNGRGCEYSCVCKKMKLPGKCAHVSEKVTESEKL